MSEGGKIIDVAAGLVFREGKLLITRRPAKAHLGGMWEFPGGKREDGETFEQCLHRELKEELGIEVDAAEAVESIVHDYPERSVHLRFFRCRWVRHEPKAIHCDEAAWVSEGDVDKYNFPAADERLLKRLRESWRQWAAF